MRAAGIDVVALDVFVRPDWSAGDNTRTMFAQTADAAMWLDAMKRLAPEMRFCFQVDRGGGLPPTLEVWPAAIRAAAESFGAHPNYYRIDGKSVMLSFWINVVPDELLAKIRHAVGDDIFFVASILENPGGRLGPLLRAVINQAAVRNTIDHFDGVDICPLGAHLPWLRNSYHTIAPMVRQAGKKLFWGVGSGYYRHGTAFIEPSYDYLNTLWQLALRSGADNVIVWTWNDFAEDHDIMPSSLKGDSLLELNSLYIQWYKSGKFPPLDGDKIFISYPFNDGIRRAPGGGECNTHPNLNYFAWMTDDGELSIPGIGSVILKKGLNVGQLGRTRVGLPARFNLARNGKIIMSGEVPRPMRQAQPGEREAMQYRYASLHKLNETEGETAKE